MGGKALVDQAAHAAASAAPAWRAATVQTRHDILTRAADGLLAQADDIARILASEEGKILSEARAEVVRASQVFRFFAGEALRIPGELVPSVRAGVEAEVTREPVGVVGLITPWNFPIAIPAWKIAPALAYGNCVVFKPAELVPATAFRLCQVLVDAGIPDGVLNLVMGTGAEIGQAIIDHPLINAISFTGSVATGRRIAAACVAAEPMKKIQLEMGGKNPLVVLDDADLSVAVECAVNGAFYSTGQRCTASSRLIVTEDVHDRFVDAVVARLAQLKIGHALDPASQIGPVVDAPATAPGPRRLRRSRLGVKLRASLRPDGCFEAGSRGTLFRPDLVHRGG